MTNKPPYADQHTVQRNRLPSHAPLRAYASKREALSRKLSSLAPPSSAAYTLPLTPAQWDFRLDASPEQAPEIIHGLGFDTADFGTIHVPRSWEAAGHGQPIYLNHRYPFKLDPPRVPADNPVGSYQRHFSLPRAWQNRRTILVLDGVGSACTVYLDGVEVGENGSGASVPCVSPRARGNDRHPHPTYAHMHALLVLRSPMPSRCIEAAHFFIFARGSRGPRFTG